MSWFDEHRKPNKLPNKKPIQLCNRKKRNDYKLCIKARHARVAEEATKAIAEGRSVPLLF